MKRLLLLLAMLSAPCLYAQVSFSPLLVGNPPGGAGAACNTQSLAYLAPNGNIYTCKSSTWQTSGGGTGCVPAGSVGQLISDDGAGGCASNSTAAGILTWIGTPSSANLAAAVTNETGSGLLVFATSPTLTTPVLGVATATSINKVAITAPTTAGTIAFAADNSTATLPNGTVMRVVASGTKALATGAISSAACTSAQTASATGTLTTDVIAATFNGDPTAVTGYVPLTTGMLTILIYPTADTFNAKVCNNTSSSITPGAITLNWSVLR